MSSEAPVDILLVDDNADNLTALEAILGEPGLSLVKVPSGKEALKALLRHDYAVILLDVNMPIMDGFETATLVRARPRSEHTPIIFITAYGDESHLARGYSLGAVDYITTPVVPEVLRAKVAVFVELFRKTREVRSQSESLQKRALQLHRLAEASLAVNATKSVDQILESLVEHARRVLGARRAEARVDLDRLRRHRAESGPPDEPLELAGLLTDSDERRIGSLQLGGAAEEGFTAEDEAVLTQLAQMASIAIQNVVHSEERETNRLKDEFLATVSHELRTPLAAMLTWTRMLRDDRLDPGRMAKGLEVIERNAKVQAQLIDDLLDMSRVMTGKVRLDPRPLDVRAVVAAAVESARPAADAQGLLLEMVQPPEAVPVLGDADRLAQVVSNLLSNAIKFTGAGGRVEVGVQQRDGEVELHVSDTGSGIDPDFLPHVFDRFRQAETASTRRHRGLGLGLAIVRHLTELHGGRVRAESAGEGRGATFVVTLPCRRDEGVPRLPLESPAAPIPATLGGLRVLVVEDEPDASEAAALLLTSAGALVRTAGSVSAAMTVLAEWIPNVVLCDIGLPREDGYTLLRRLRAFVAERGIAIPAVAMTAYAQPDDRARALAAGFEVHLAKPVDPDELLRTLAAYRARDPKDAALRA